MNSKKRKSDPVAYVSQDFRALFESAGWATDRAAAAYLIRNARAAVTAWRHHKKEAAAERRKIVSLAEKIRSTFEQENPQRSP